MRTGPWGLLAPALLVASTGQVVTSGATSARAADLPSLTVDGPAAMFPVFDPDVGRYAVRRAPDGSVRVTVAGAAAVWFDGVPDPDATTSYTGLRPGDEISVFIETSTGREAYALHVLPDDFPTLSTTSTGAALEPGNIALTLDRFDGRSPRFEAIVDRNGVPVHTRSHGDRVLDLKRAANGRLTVHRPTTTPGRTGGALVELDDRFQEVRRHETTGLVNTDDHDSLLLPDGSSWLLAYEPNPTTGLVDSVIQHRDPDGAVIWEWTSEPYADETTLPGDPDYAHINSIHVQPNGDVLASFRNLSSVFLIRPGGGPEEVVWKLGGRDSSFTFPAGDVGPCAQHSATLLPNGNVLLFDNGSSTFFGPPLCVDQDDPARPSVARPSTRVVEFALSGGAATPVRTYGDTDRFAWFMGSATRTPSGNVLIGWSSAPDSIATETDAAGATIWRLRDERTPVGGAVPRPYITYRAALVPTVDGFDPDVAVDGPADASTFVQGETVPVRFSCTDRGGSVLQSCEGPAGRRLETSTPGTHTWSVTARDGSGRTTTVTRSYVVTPLPAPTSPPTPVPPVTTAPPSVGPVPDLSVRRRPGGRWTGAGRVFPETQTARFALPQSGLGGSVRIANTGDAPGRFLLRAPDTLAKGALRVSYRVRGAVRTVQIGRRTGWRTPVVAPGDRLLLTFHVTLRDRSARGRAVLPLRASSPDRRDVVRVVLSRRDGSL